MKTAYFSKQSLSKAAQLLQAGELVAFPTETVYGLGALASHSLAIQRLYAVKQRPEHKALIVLFASKQQVFNFFPNLTAEIKFLMKNFWPGPLTIIVPNSSQQFAEEVTANKATVAIRVPGNRLTRQLIEMVGEPIVAPSANFSGQSPPKNASQVKATFDGLIAGIVEDQTQEFFDKESTIVEWTPTGLKIWRKGAITEQQLTDAYQVDNNSLQQ